MMMKKVFHYEIALTNKKTLNMGTYKSDFTCNFKIFFGIAIENYCNYVNENGYEFEQTPMILKIMLKVTVDS